MAKSADRDYRSIIADIKDKIYAPVYFLHGDEPYFIDVVRDYIEDNVLSESEKSFNQDVFFGSDTNAKNILTTAKGFPMGADKRVIIVKEAQNIKDLDNISLYLKNPQPSTILVFAHMKKADGRKKYLADIVKAGGVVYESVPFKYDSQVSNFITNLFKEKGMNIDPPAVQLMADNLGRDLHKIVNEADKLMISKPADTKVISVDMIKRFVGFSNQYTNFDFKAAIIAKDVFKANKIAKYFAENPKQNPIQPILSLLFGFFSNLMLYYYISDKSDYNVASELSISPYVAKEYAMAASKFSAWQTMRIIHELRLADAASKGINNSSASSGDLLIELVYHIMYDKK